MTWGHFGIILGHIGVTLASLRGDLGLHWAYFGGHRGDLGALWGYFGQTRATLGRFALTLWALWRHFGAIWKNLLTYDRAFGTPWDDFGDTLRPSWVHFWHVKVALESL